MVKIITQKAINYKQNKKNSMVIEKISPYKWVISIILKNYMK